MQGGSMLGRGHDDRSTLLGWPYPSASGQVIPNKTREHAQWVPSEPPISQTVVHMDMCNVRR